MIKFGIVGCGRVAKVHAEAIHESEHAELFALCDINPARLSHFAEAYEVTQIFDQFEAMAGDPDIDVINICTPNGLHAEMAVLAMKKGKHVIIEKPLATTVKDASQIIQTARECRVKATVVHQNRFNQAIQTTRKALEKDRFGALSYGAASIRWHRSQGYYNQDAWRGTRKMADGALMNQGIHTIDLLIWMMGPVKRISGKVLTKLRNIEMEDIGTAIFEFESGAVAILDGTVTVYPDDLGASLHLFGEKGTVCIGGNAVNRIEKWRFSEDFTLEEQTMLNQQKADPPSVYGDGHKHVVKDFIQSLHEDRNPYIPLEAGLNAVRAILAIYESSKDGKTILLNNSASTTIS
ncbi:Gfo/Idh/MocA family oxidoreductase [Halobacillus salinarum]|uniref:Gfo/Idh/MocA family oxidoreductase n=1 Tax=Halobacillus salinarum TaxID=2932257 RepID=A0ABY4EI73_9BACI|nr:Gfo/Idh/MocA family oxidoreductase [Halobacillus salinarum]UOQ44184.1 Gfo/Idh/MocA family oxidoreductase [Halobacillus salinarum]